MASAPVPPVAAAHDRERLVEHHDNIAHRDTAERAAPQPPAPGSEDNPCGLGWSDTPLDGPLAVVDLVLVSATDDDHGQDDDCGDDEPDADRERRLRPPRPTTLPSP